jgi:diketogulonate reductase-like aldo/keto reductase
MSTDETRDEELALETIAAAAKAGITVFDTAHAYGRGEADLGHNETLLARGLRRASADVRARIVTKGGMARTGGGWIPDGRAKAIRADCEASLAALDGLAIDLYLIHAPDPGTPWRTSVRALARLVDEGLVRRVGIANVNRRQLDEALELAPVAAVQVALSPYDDRPLRGGVVDRCAEARIAVIAHSPLGGREEWSGARDVRSHLGIYGGMGSFNDVLLTAANGHRVSRAQEGWVNACFVGLKSACWAAASQIARPDQESGDGTAETSQLELQGWVCRPAASATSTRIGYRTLLRDAGPGGRSLRQSPRAEEQPSRDGRTTSMRIPSVWRIYASSRRPLTPSDIRPFRTASTS